MRRSLVRILYNPTGDRSSPFPFAVYPENTLHPCTCTKMLKPYSLSSRMAATFPALGFALVALAPIHHFLSVTSKAVLFAVERGNTHQVLSSCSSWVCSSSIAPKAASLGALLLAVLSVVAGASFRKQLDHFLPHLDFDDTRGCIAVAGLAIFCIAFFRGSSYDYRLIFLVGAIACRSKI